MSRPELRQSRAVMSLLVGLNSFPSQNFYVRSFTGDSALADLQTEINRLITCCDHAAEPVDAA